MASQAEVEHALGQRFQLLGAIGRGAMGVVYRAREPELGRDVAVKVILGLDERAAKRRARFEREAQITASLDHPGIVRVHSMGEVLGVPYIACELLEGARSLSEVFGELELRRRVELVRDAARALGYAHGAGVIHRDVKPENLLVDEAGRLKVADFGLGWARGVQRLTQTGALLGTPSHMAPEQAGRGKAGETVGPHTDVWALGVILYEAMTGALPFEGDALNEVLAKISEARFTAPRVLDRSLDAGLEAVCLRCLQAEPEARYPGGDALADDLERWLGGETPSASSVGHLARAVRLARRWRWALGALAPLTLLILAAWYAFSPPPEIPQQPIPTDPAPTLSQPAANEGASVEAPPALSRGAVRAGRKELASLLRGEPQAGPDRLEGLEDWLERYAGHPDAARAGLARAQALLVEPVHVLEHRAGALATWKPPSIQAIPPVALEVQGQFVDDERVVTFGGDGTVRLWRVDDPATPHREWVLAQPVLCGEPLDTERFMVGCGRYLSVVTLSGEGGIPERWRAADMVRSLAVRRLRGGSWEFAAGAGAVIQVVAYGDAGFGGERTVHTYPGGPIAALAFFDGGRSLFACASRGESSAIVLASDSWKLRFAPKIFWFQAPALIAAGAGREVVAGNRSGSLFVFRPDAPDYARRIPRGPFDPKDDVPTMETLSRGEQRSHLGQILGLALSASGKTLFSAAAVRAGIGGEGLNELAVWRYEDGKELARVPLPAMPRSLSLSSDGRLLAVGLDDGTVQLRRVAFP